MTDFHTHILPKMDDGSKSVEESLQMLREEYRQGVRDVVMTPHFYATQNDPQEFLKRRRASWEMLQPHLDQDMPRITLGAEVQFFEGIEHVEDLHLLRMGDSLLMLLEMPFCKWENRMIHAVLDINSRSDFQIVLAHIERYFSFVPDSMWEYLRDNGVMMQMNTSNFSGWFSKRKAMNMVRNGLVHMIGTDCHNLSTRKPDWSPVSSEVLEMTRENAVELLRNI